MTRHEIDPLTNHRRIGTPYRHQASLKGVGCDCLGLVRGVWRALNGAEPEAAPAYTADWAEAGGNESLAAAARHLVAVELANAMPRRRLAVPLAGASAGQARGRRRRLAYAFRFPAIGRPDLA